MKRTTMPDQYSDLVKTAYEQLRAGRATPALFSTIIRAIWYNRLKEARNA